MVVDIADAQAPGPHGSVPVRVYLPESPSGEGLVWLHGGAFVMGDLDVPEADLTARQLAESGITVVSVDYRLAVEGVHFPVPLDDVLAAWSWATSASGGGFSAVSRWHIGGGSAGGNLAAALAVRLRDTGAEAPRSSILLYPVLHDTIPELDAELAAALLDAPTDRRFDSAESQRLNLNYVGEEALLTHPWAFPVHAGGAGLPPTVIVTSDVDSLRPSGEAYAALLAAAGTDVSIVREKGTLHGHLNDVGTPGALASLERIRMWIAAVS